MLAELLLTCFAALRPALPVFPVGSPSAFSACEEQVPLQSTSGPDAGETRGSDGSPPVLPVIPSRSTKPSGSVDWRKLTRDSVRLAAIMHGFRWATEPGTRSAGVGLGRGYVRALGNLHGWADGDPFYVNYVGHPMQGAVSSRLYLLNNERFNPTEFGRSREYWKGKLRAAAFAWVFSEQFEVGPFSEASVGHVQVSFPQQGFGDHVVTPVIGMAWMVGEDALDRYVVRRVEDFTTNVWLRLTLRTALNPARTFANVVGGKVPWYRGSRAGVVSYRKLTGTARDLDEHSAVTSNQPPPFEFTVVPGWRQFAGGSCVGGGAEGAYRLSAELQIVLAVNGCKLTGLERDLSGDALFYQVGPRWTPSPTGRWSPYAQLLIGGTKITHEQLYPEQKAAVEEANRNLDPTLLYTLHEQYTRREETSGLAISAGTGVDYKLNNALALRLASLEYFRSSAGALGGLSYGRGLQVSTGLVLRLGTW